MSYALTYLFWMLAVVTGAPQGDACGVDVYAEATVCLQMAPPPEEPEPRASDARQRRPDLAISNGF